MWNRRVCVGFLETLYLGKFKSGKYPRESNERTGQIEGRQVNCEQTWKSVYELEFWELYDWVESGVRLAAEEIGGKREEQERRTWTTYWRVPSPISKMAPAYRASGKGVTEMQMENQETESRKQEGERWDGYGNNKDWFIIWWEFLPMRDVTVIRKQRHGPINILKEADKQAT